MTRNARNSNPDSNLMLCILLFLLMFMVVGFKAHHKYPFIEKLPRQGVVLPDLSGLAWISGDLFLAVHDAKNPEESSLPRISLIQLPSGLDGVGSRAIYPNFKGPKSDDLESIARIPGTGKFLLVESTGDHDTKPFSHRIFLAELIKNQLKIIDTIEWPVDTQNIEGTAVAKINDDYIFIFAERAHGDPGTEIQFAHLHSDPLSIDNFDSAGLFTSPGPTGPNARPVTAMDVDSEGSIYVVSAYDPDDDNGPFKSALYKIGSVVSAGGVPDVVLDATPETIAVLDGIKVESVAVCERNPGTKEIFIGTDDENYGGILRPIPPD